MPKSQTQTLIPYICKSKPLQGNRYIDIMPQVRRLFRTLQKKTKRRLYVRSAYFRKDKIFFDYFWNHMNQKLPSDRARRLKFLPCALELTRNTRHDPLTFEELDKRGELLHRFAGKTSDGRLFYVQIKQEKRTGKKQFMSLFPAQ